MIILAALCIAMGVYSENFRNTGNLQSVVSRTSIIGIIAVGQLLVILTAGIDLSVGSVAALSGVVGCVLVSSAENYFGLPMPIGLLGGVLCGAACGFVNGVLVTKGRIPPFIVTLGMMMVARGLALLVSSAEPIYNLPDSMEWLAGTAQVGDTIIWWTPVAIMVAITLIIAVMLYFTPLGRTMYAIGGNKKAARLSGLAVDRAQIIAFTICGTLAGLAGMMLAAKTSIGAPMAAEMYELDAIAACVIGGASLMGGEGGAIATLAGALIMSVMQNFCTLENIPVHWQRVFIGSLIIALVFYDGYRKRKAGLFNE